MTSARPPLGPDSSQAGSGPPRPTAPEEGGSRRWRPKALPTGLHLKRKVRFKPQ